MGKKRPRTTRQGLVARVGCMQLWTWLSASLALALAAAPGCSSDDAGGSGGAAGSAGAGAAGGGGTAGSGGSGAAAGSGGSGATAGSGASAGSGGSQSCVTTIETCTNGVITSDTCDPCVTIDCDMPGNYVSCGGGTCVFAGQTCPDLDAGDAADGEG